MAAFKRGDVRLDYLPRSLHGGCSCCGKPSRMLVIDTDRDLPICKGCVEPCVEAAVALRDADLTPPDATLITLNP